MAPRTNQRSGFAQRSHRRKSISKEIERIENTSGEALRKMWRKRFACRTPLAKSDEIFRLIYAWRLQMRMFGGVEQMTMDRLAEIRRAISRGTEISPAVTLLKPGMVLTRVWHGKEHRVLVREAGYEHEGQLYRTLTHVARAIAGPPYSGPAFFGMSASGSKAFVERPR